MPVPGMRGLADPTGPGRRTINLRFDMCTRSGGGGRAGLATRWHPGDGTLQKISTARRGVRRNERGRGGAGGGGGGGRTSPGRVSSTHTLTGRGRRLPRSSPKVCAIDMATCTAPSSRRESAAECVTGACRAGSEGPAAPTKPVLPGQQTDRPMSGPLPPDADDAIWYDGRPQEARLLLPLPITCRLAVRRSTCCEATVKPSAAYEIRPGERPALTLAILRLGRRCQHASMQGRPALAF